MKWFIFIIYFLIITQKNIAHNVFNNTYKKGVNEKGLLNDISSTSILTTDSDLQKKWLRMYNSAVDFYNCGIRYFNDYIRYRNKQFLPARTDNEIQVMLDSVQVQITNSKNKLNEIQNPDVGMSYLITRLSKSIDDFSCHLEQQQCWLERYRNKSKLGRKLMFKKYSWLGLEMNCDY